MPANSETTRPTLATTRQTRAKVAARRVNSSRIRAASPLPVKAPSRAAISCTHDEGHGDQHHEEQGPVAEQGARRGVGDDAAGVVAGVGRDDARAGPGQVGQESPPPRRLRIAGDGVRGAGASRPRRSRRSPFQEQAGKVEPAPLGYERVHDVVGQDAPDWPTLVVDDHDRRAAGLDQLVRPRRGTSCVEARPSPGRIPRAALRASGRRPRWPGRTALTSSR